MFSGRRAAGEPSIRKSPDMRSSCSSMNEPSTVSSPHNDCSAVSNKVIITLELLVNSKSLINRAQLNTVQRHEVNSRASNGQAGEAQLQFIKNTFRMYSSTDIYVGPCQLVPMTGTLPNYNLVQIYSYCSIL